MPKESNSPDPSTSSSNPKKNAPMKPKELQELIDFIAKSGLNKVNIETEDFKLSIQREPTQKIKMVGGSSESQPMQHLQHHAAPPQMLQMPAAAAIAPAAAAPAPAAAPVAAAATGTPLKAPMIGTFYRSGGPDQPPFASVGDVVEKGQIICIIEAMKLFNEIEAEQGGRIVKVLVENASPVEYDQPLFLIEAA